MTPLSRYAFEFGACCATAAIALRQAVLVEKVRLRTSLASRLVVSKSWEEGRAAAAVTRDFRGNSTASRLPWRRIAGVLPAILVEKAITAVLELEAVG